MIITNLSLISLRTISDILANKRLFIHKNVLSMRETSFHQQLSGLKIESNPYRYEGPITPVVGYAEDNDSISLKSKVFLVVIMGFNMLMLGWFIYRTKRCGKNWEEKSERPLSTFLTF